MIVTDEDGFASFATFRCPMCGSEVNDLIFVAESSITKREDGLSPQGEAEIMCGHCTSQYRLKVRNSAGRVVAKIIEHPQVAVTCVDALTLAELDDPLVYWAMSDEPSDNLVDALKDIEEVINIQDAGFYMKPLGRMAFIQQFAALEAYLADTLTKQILQNPDALQRAVVGFKELKEIKLTLAEVASSPDIVKLTVAKSLLDIMYHNFEKVDAIWRVALGFSLFPDAHLKQRLFMYLPIRHDCVHRNGKDKGGVERADIDFDFVSQVGADIHALLDHIEDSLHQYVDDEDDPDLTSR